MVVARPQKPRQTGETQTRLRLTRVFPVCFSDKHFVHFSPENQLFIWEQKNKFYNIYCSVSVSDVLMIIQKYIPFMP